MNNLIVNSIVRFNDLSILNKFYSKRVLNFSTTCRDLYSLVFSDINQPRIHPKILLGSRERLDLETIRVIERSEEFVFFAQLDFAMENITEELISAVRRGVKVRGIVERRMAEIEPRKSLIKKLWYDGSYVIVPPKQNGWMHLKILVTEKEALSGSYNWTEEATFDNDEVLEVYCDVETRLKMIEIFDEIADKYGKYKYRKTR